MLLKMLILVGNFWDNWYPPPDLDASATLKYLSVKCGRNFPVSNSHCTNYCLFNIDDDPCEINDLSKEFPLMFERLLNKLSVYKRSMVSPRNNMTVDPKSDPMLHNGVWQPWVVLD